MKIKCTTGHNPLIATQKGVALVLVLWMLALLTVVANSLAFSVRTELHAATNLTAMAQSEAAADAGVFKAIYELMRPESDPLRWQANGLVHTWEFDNILLRISISDESGKIDLNAAPSLLFTGLFQALSLPEAEALALADAIIDWRDPDDLRGLHGAERAEYAAAGKTYGPANAPFQTIAELKLVLGMNEALYRSLESLVTVYSRRNWVNASVAPALVLQALPGTTREQVAWFLDQRQFMLERGLPPPQFPLAQGLSGAVLFYGIQVEAILGDNIVFSREAVVRLTGNAAEPFVFLAWRAPKPNVSLSPDSALAVPHGQSR